MDKPGLDISLTSQSILNNSIHNSTLDLTIDQSQKQEMVHSLYTKLISKDLSTSKDKTQA